MGTSHGNGAAELEILYRISPRISSAADRDLARDSSVARDDAPT
jgi:hypothetical protein